jgi:hypothetical protein
LTAAGAAEAEPLEDRLHLARERRELVRRPDERIVRALK